MNSKRAFLATLGAMAAAGALSLSFPSIAQDQNNPLTPAYKSKLGKLRDDFIAMCKKHDKDMDGMITGDEYLHGMDPLHPSYAKRKAQWDDMLAKMDKNGDGMLSLNEYMSDGNPLHPRHKF